MNTDRTSCPHCGMDRDFREASGLGAGSTSWLELLVMAVAFPLVFAGASLWQDIVPPDFELGRTGSAIALSLAIIGGIAIQKVITGRTGRS